MKKLLLSFLFTSSLFAMQRDKFEALLAYNNVQEQSVAKQLNPESVHAPERMGTVALFQDENGFYAVTNGIRRDIQPAYCNEILNKAKEAGKVDELLKDGYIWMKELENNEIALEANLRLKGGGPLCAWWAYHFTKATIYGTVGIAAGAAISTVVASTGGGAIPVAASYMASETVGLGLGSSAAIGAGTSIAGVGAGSLVVSAVGAETVGTATVGLAASSGGFWGLLGLVEVASVGVGALFAGPWCP